MTTFEPVGYRSIRTGALMSSLDSVHDYGVRNPRGRRMREAEWSEYVVANYEVVYREIK